MKRKRGMYYHVCVLAPLSETASIPRYIHTQPGGEVLVFAFDGKKRYQYLEKDLLPQAASSIELVGYIYHASAPALLPNLDTSGHRPT